MPSVDSWARQPPVFGRLSRSDEALRRVADAGRAVSFHSRRRGRYQSVSRQTACEAAGIRGSGADRRAAWQTSNGDAGKIEARTGGAAEDRHGGHRGEQSLEAGTED